MRTESCDRCGAKMHGRVKRNQELTVGKHTDENSYEHNTILICGSCENDLWEWAHEDVDRSDMLDPVFFERIEENVERHIEDLEGVLNELRGENE